MHRKYLHIENNPSTIRERLDPLIIIAVSCLVFFIQSLAWPLSLGRDGGTYLIYYIDMWKSNPTYPMLMLYRTPIVPLFFGFLLQIGRSILTECIMGLCFCISILAVYRIGLLHSRKVALISSIAVLLQPSYGSLYHVVSSDGPFAFIFILWAVYICNTWISPKSLKFIWHGIFVFILILTRPSSQILLIFAGFPFFLPQLRVWQKIKNSCIFLLTIIPLILLYSNYNYVRYNDFAISRSFNAAILHRLFVIDRTVRPENGPFSAELAQAVKSDLLKKEPYISYNISLDTFFNSGSYRMYSDLIGLSDRTWGWDSDYRKLREVAIEAIVKHPVSSVKSVVLALAKMLVGNYKHYVPSKEYTRKIENNRSLVNNKKSLPVPTENELIPGSNLWWVASTPDNRFEYDWQYYYDHGLLKVKNAKLQQRIDKLHTELNITFPPLASRKGFYLIARILHIFAKIYPPMLIWIIIGLVGFYSYPNSAIKILLLISNLAFLILIITSLFAESTYQYRIPFDPLFIIFGIVGFITYLKRNRNPSI